MEKLITTTSQITTTITSNTTGKNTYAIERTPWFGDIAQFA